MAYYHKYFHLIPKDFLLTNYIDSVGFDVSLSNEMIGFLDYRLRRSSLYEHNSKFTKQVIRWGEDDGNGFELVGLDKEYFKASFQIDARFPTEFINEFLEVTTKHNCNLIVEQQSNGEHFLIKPNEQKIFESINNDEKLSYYLSKEFIELGTKKADKTLPNLKNFKK